MAQMDTAISSRLTEVEYSTTGTSGWTSIAGHSQSVEPGEMTRAMGTTKTLDGDRTIITPGKLDEMDLVFNILYDEGATAPHTVFWGLFNGANPLWIRYSPYGGNTTGEDIWTTDKGYIRAMTPPQFDANSADPLAFSFTLITSGLSKSDAA